MFFVGLLTGISIGILGFRYSVWKKIYYRGYENGLKYNKNNEE